MLPQVKGLGDLAAQNLHNFDFESIPKLIKYNTKKDLQKLLDWYPILMGIGG